MEAPKRSIPPFRGAAGCAKLTRFRRVGGLPYVSASGIARRRSAKDRAGLPEISPKMIARRPPARWLSLAVAKLKKRTSHVWAFKMGHD
jgi:hypothetical protein